MGWFGENDVEQFIREFWGPFFAPIEWQMDMVEKLSAEFTPIVIDATFLATVPHALGAVVKMRRMKDRVIAETESGIPMIVPHRCAR